MIVNISKVRSVAAGYTCTCSELITENFLCKSLVRRHYNYRALLQDPKPFICYCKLTPENEDVWGGRADTLLPGSPVGRAAQLLQCEHLEKQHPGHTGTTSSSLLWKAEPGSTTVSVSAALPRSPHPASRSTSCSRAETLHRAGPAHSPQRKRLRQTIYESACSGI